MPLHRILKVGKVPSDILNDLIFKKCGAYRKEALIRPGIGEDTAVLNFGHEYVVASTDPITGADDSLGRLGVKIALNDIGTAGAEPVCILVTLLMPVGSTLEMLEKIMNEVHVSCLEENVVLAGGHTEITSSVNKPIISVTALGKSLDKKVLSASFAREGDDILLTKWAGMEATSILVSDFPGVFKKRLGDKEFKEAIDLIKKISVVKDGRIAAQNGATAAHDATEGGVLGAIYEMATACNKGAEVWLEKIPLLSVTRKVAKIAKIDPLRAVSSGCLLVSTGDGEGLKSVYEKAGINAEVVGKIISGESRLLGCGMQYPLEAPGPDQLYKGRAYLEEISGAR